jgi:pimeloyl-ACP methyl ester carboxylesterase
MATAVSGELQARGVLGDWDVVTLDWRNFAGGSDDPESGPAKFDPWESANNGINIGESLATWMQAVGLNNYQQIHILGHSSGSWLADSLADQLHQRGANVQLTMFDAFVPGSVPNPITGELIQRYGDPMQPVLGDNANFAEQIVDTRLLPPFLPKWILNLVSRPTQFTIMLGLISGTRER